MRGKLSSRQTLRARSGLLNRRIMTGVIWLSYSSSLIFVAMRMTIPNGFGPPPPNSTDLRSSGKTLTLKNSSGKSSDSATVSSSLKVVSKCFRTARLIQLTSRMLLSLSRTSIRGCRCHPSTQSEAYQRSLHFCCLAPGNVLCSNASLAQHVSSVCSLSAS